MARSEDVFSIIPVGPTDTVVTSNNANLQDLNSGVLGFYRSGSNLSIFDDGVTTLESPVREFFVAYGHGSTAGQPATKLRKSAGQSIQVNNIVNYNVRPYTPPQLMALDIANLCADCESTYTVRVQFQTPEIYQKIGTVGKIKSFSVTTGCCDDCATCPAYDTNLLVRDMRNLINADEENLVTAEIIAVAALTIAGDSTSQDYAPGDVIDVEDDLTIAIAKYSADNTDDDNTNDTVLTLRLTATAEAVETFCDVNTSYAYPRGIKLIASLAGDWQDNCCSSAAITTATALAYEEGSGYDFHWREYEANGWNGLNKAFRQSSALNGLVVRDPDVESLVDATANYHTIIIQHDHKSQSAWLDYSSPLHTVILVNTANDTALDDIVRTLDAIVAQVNFDRLVDDVAAIDSDTDVDTNLAPTSGASDAEDDTQG